MRVLLSTDADAFAYSVGHGLEKRFAILDYVNFLPLNRDLAYRGEINGIQVKR